MGSMANEMRARMEADGGAGLPNGGDGGAAPGDAGVPPADGAQAAGPSNTDTAPAGGTPETIPYARFKEVNDRYSELKPFEELTQYGYDADSLRRLAAFETSYLQDPYGTLAAMAENLELPQDVVEALKASVPGGETAPGSAEGRTPSQGEQSAPLPPEVQARLDYVDRLQERDAEAAREAQLNTVVEAWDQMDKADDISTPERIKLMAISAAAASGQQFRTHEDLARFARETINEFRGEVVGSSVRTGRGGTTPPALPSGAPPAAGPVKFRDIREATKAAEAATLRGELPPVQS